MDTMINRAKIKALMNENEGKKNGDRLLLGKCKKGTGYFYGTLLRLLGDLLHPLIKLIRTHRFKLR